MGTTAGAVACLALAVALSTSADRVGAASSGSTSVAATIAPLTSMSVTSCGNGVAGMTDLGSVVVGSTSLSSVDCTVEFGSTAAPAVLRLQQSDGAGTGMWSPSSGAIDTGFGAGGTRTTSFTAGALTDDPAAMAVHTDGTIVVAGSCDPGSGVNDLCLARYNAAGSLDPTFQGDGTVMTDLFGANDMIYGLTVQPDGKPVAVGGCFVPGPSIDFCVARYATDGSLDTTFSGDGLASYHLGDVASNSDAATTVKVLADGSLVVVGWCEQAATGHDLCAIRISSTGVQDMSFGTGGRASVAVGPGTATDHAFGVEVDASGRYVIGGHCNMGATAMDFCLTRLLPNGQLDTTFGAGGIRVTSIAPGAGDDFGSLAGMQSTGKLIVTGLCMVATYDLCVARYSADGNLDTTFGSAGIVLVGYSNGHDGAWDAMVAPDDRIYSSGDCHTGATNLHDFCVQRLLPDGAFDATFGTGGTAVVPVVAGATSEFANNLAARSDGALVISGKCVPGGGTGTDFCLAGLRSNGSIADYSGTSNWTTPGTSAFGACLHTVGAGVTADWTPHPTCDATNGAHWQPVAASAATIAHTTASGLGSVGVRFGMRPGPSQAPGRYLAPVTFTVAAP